MIVLVLACPVRRMRYMRLMSFSRALVGRWMFGVRCWTFVLFNRHKFHSAFRTISRMIGYDLRMHRAGVLLRLLLLACRARAVCWRVLMLAGRAIEVTGLYLCAGVRRKCNYDRQKQNLFIHAI